MSLILFVHKNASPKGDSFKSVIDQNFKSLKIEIFNTLETFKSRLKQISIYHKEIHILFVDSKNRLEKLTELIDLLEDKRIILILPDDSEPTISMAHKFFPRFFTYINDPYDNLCGVINKMMNSQTVNIP